MQNNCSLKNLILFSCIIAVYCVQAQPHYGKIGTGVSMSQWTKTFVDVMKLSRPFQNIAGNAPAEMDTLGFPLEDCQIIVSESWPVAEWQNDIDDPAEFRPDFSGTYLCSFVGQANVSRVWGDFTLHNIEFDEEANLTTFELEIGQPRGGSGYGFIQLRFSDTRRTPENDLNTGITDLKVIRPGYAIDTDQLITDEYVDCANAADFSALRYMGWTHTNNGSGDNDPNNPDYPDQLEWSDRRPLNAATYRKNAAISSEHGGPWESVIELANIVGNDVWINVPVASSEDYVRELATLFREYLNEDLNIYVELSNEVWNRGFKQAQWCIDYGEDHGLGGFNNYADEAYAHLTAEVALVFEEVFGEGSINNRIRVIICWQIGAWQPENHFANQLDYISENFREANTLVYGIAVAPYFSAGNALLNGSVAEIHEIMLESSDNSRERRADISRLAEDFELIGGMMAYEGGSATGGGNPQNVANRILAERDSTLKNLMIHDLSDNWFPLGGELFMYLEMAGSYNRYGCWGLTDDILDPDRNYKFEAVRELIGEAPENGIPSKHDMSNKFITYQVFPNPFNSRLTIKFQVNGYSRIDVNLVNINGRTVNSLLTNAYFNSGSHQFSANVNNLPNGIYYLHMKWYNGNSIIPIYLIK